MRNPFFGVVAIALVGSLLAPAPAATADMRQWFLGATGFLKDDHAMKTAKPDFLLSSSFGGTRKQPCSLKTGALQPNFYGTWQLAKYDRTHHIALGHADTDASAVALFEAPAPAVSVPDADLSQCGTGRGLHIGSPYSAVLSTYGPSAKHGRHFITTYDALVPDVRSAFRTRISWIPNG
jgi:hypothetical protein